MRKKDPLSQDQKLTKSLACLPRHSRPEPAVPKDLADKLILAKKLFTRMMTQIFLPKFEKVEQEILKDKRFFIIEQRQSSVYISFFENLHVELNRDPTVVYGGKTQAELEAGLKNVKIGMKAQGRFMESHGGVTARGATSTNASNVFSKRKTTGSAMDVSFRPDSHQPLDTNLRKKASLHHIDPAFLKTDLPGRKHSTASFVNLPSIKPLKPSKLSLSRDVMIPKSSNSNQDLDVTVRIESSAASKKDGSARQRTNENNMRVANTRIKGPRGQDSDRVPKEFSLDQSDFFSHALSLLQFGKGDSDDEGKDPKKSKKGAKDKKKTRQEIFDEFEELEHGSDSHGSDEKKQKGSGKATAQKNFNKIAPAFVLPDMDETIKAFPSDIIVDDSIDFAPKKTQPAATPSSDSHINKTPNQVLEESSIDASIVGSFLPKSLIDHDPLYNPLPDIEALEKILYEREANVRQEHFAMTKEQIIEKARKFLPENSRTLQLFSKSHSGDADILVDSMRFSLKTRIGDVEKQIAQAKTEWPDFDDKNDLPRIRTLPFIPSKLCMLAFHTVSKKDVLRGMSPELLSPDMAKIFIMFYYIHMENEGLLKIEEKSKTDLLSDICDYYMAQLEQHVDDEIRKCHLLPLLDKMKLEEYLDNNKAAFRVISDVNLNSFYLSVAFMVFEVLFYYGMRRFVIFMEKRKDKEMIRRNVGFELKYLLEKRDFYERKMKDLATLEKELHTYNGWNVDQ